MMRKWQASYILNLSVNYDFQFDLLLKRQSFEE